MSRKGIPQGTTFIIRASPAVDYAPDVAIVGVAQSLERSTAIARQAMRRTLQDNGLDRFLEDLSDYGSALVTAQRWKAMVQFDAHDFMCLWSAERLANHLSRHFNFAAGRTLFPPSAFEWVLKDG